MAREVEIHAWCDACLDDDKRHAAQTFTFTMPGERFPRAVELCEVHEKQYVAELADLLARRGHAVDEGDRPAGPATPAPGARAAIRALPPPRRPAASSPTSPGTARARASAGGPRAPRCPRRCCPARAAAPGSGPSRG